MTRRDRIVLLDAHTDEIVRTATRGDIITSARNPVELVTYPDQYSPPHAAYLARITRDEHGNEISTALGDAEIAMLYTAIVGVVCEEP